MRGVGGVEKMEKRDNSTLFIIMFVNGLIFRIF